MHHLGYGGHDEHSPQTDSSFSLALRANVRLSLSLFEASTKIGWNIGPPLISLWLLKVHACLYFN
jgi:hypothetical protein